MDNHKVEPKKIKKKIKKKYSEREDDILDDKPKPPNQKAKSQIIFVKDEESDEIEDDLDPIRLPYESPKGIYEIIQSKKITIKILKQMKQSMLANDFWLPEFELYGGINALLKLLSSKVPFNLQPSILDIIEDIAHIYPLMIMNAPGSIKFILHNFHCENIIVRTHIIKVLHELITYNSITHEKLILGLSAYEQFIYGKNTPAFTSILDLLTDGREERNEFAVENSIRFINGIIDTPASLLVRVQLRSHIKSLKIPYLFELILNEYDSEDIKKQVDSFNESSKLEDECFQDMNVNHIREPTTLMTQMNKIFSTKSYHPIFLSIIHNLYITAHDKKDGKKQLNKIHKFLYKPEIPNLDSRTYLPPMGQHEDVPPTAVPKKLKRVLKKKKKKSSNPSNLNTGPVTKTKINEPKVNGESDSDSNKELGSDSQDNDESILKKQSISSRDSYSSRNNSTTKYSSVEDIKGNVNSKSEELNGTSLLEIQDIINENNRLKEENEKLKHTLTEKENFIREREVVNLESYKRFKEKESKCKEQITDVLDLFKKQIESYKLLTRLNMSHAVSSNNLHSITENINESEEK